MDIRKIVRDIKDIALGKKVVVIVQCRLSSTRLPGKALKKLGDISYEVYIVHGIVVLYLLDLLNGVCLLLAVLGISIFISVYLNKVSAFYIKKIIKWRKIY